MSLSATAAAVPHEPAETRKLLLLIWGVTVATYLLTGSRRGQNLSTDDAMRLVQVRDLLAGQGWFDLDAVPAEPARRRRDALVAADRPADRDPHPRRRDGAADRDGGTWCDDLWPAGLLLALLSASPGSRANSPATAAARLALIFAALTAPVLQHFRPGAIDHHNVQLVLTDLVARACWSRAAAPRDAALAGALSALSLAIGQEMAPAIAALAALRRPALDRARRTSRERRPHSDWRSRPATLVLFVATVPPARYAVATCDALSIVHVADRGCGGFGLATWRRGARARRPWQARRRRRRARRSCSRAMLALGFPGLPRRPLRHLDPRLAALWLSNVNEARSIVSMMRDLPQEVLPYYGLAALGARARPAIVAGARPATRRWGWIAAHRRPARS